MKLRALLPGDELLNYGRAGDTVPALLTTRTHCPRAGRSGGRLDRGQRRLPGRLVSAGAGRPREWRWAGRGRRPRPARRRRPAALRGPPVATCRRPPAASDAYDRVLDIALTHATLAVCVPPVLPDPFEEGGIAERVAGIGAMIVDAATARGSQVRAFDLAPVFAAAAAATGYGFTIDGVHLSARGADVVAAAFGDLVATLRRERPVTAWAERQHGAATLPDHAGGLSSLAVVEPGHGLHPRVRRLRSLLRRTVRRALAGPTGAPLRAREAGLERQDGGLTDRRAAKAVRCAGGAARRPAAPPRGAASAARAPLSPSR